MLLSKTGKKNYLKRNAERKFGSVFTGAIKGRLGLLCHVDCTLLLFCFCEFLFNHKMPISLILFYSKINLKMVVL